MLGLFKSNSLPPESLILWIFDVYEWLLEHTGGTEQFQQSYLITPTPEYYPDPDGEDLAQHLFQITKEHAGMQDWPCRLEAHSNAPSASDVLGRAPASYSQTAGAAGTFRIAPNQEIVITYAEKSLADPVSFIGTMAHELSHYLMGTIPVDPPGGDEAEEPATDVCAVFLGFGIFVANGAVRFSQFNDGATIGWSMSRKGYLSEQALAYALAVFLELHGLPRSAATSHLDPNPRAYLKAALRDIRKKRSASLARLRPS
ncbi:MAG: hypothetical protein AAFX94_12725 [Myxococcota bacterium]